MIVASFYLGFSINPNNPLYTSINIVSFDPPQYDQDSKKPWKVSVIGSDVP